MKLIPARFLAVWLVLAGFAVQAQTNAPDDWLKWRARRSQSLGSSNGWTSLVGLHWLHEGQNFVGSDPTNDAVFPEGRAPGRVGVFVREGKSVRFHAETKTEVTVDRPATSGWVEMKSDATDAPTKLRVGDLSIVVIERGDRIGLRVRDPQSPTRLHFRPPECFAYDPSWRVSAMFEKYLRPQTRQIADVTGGTQEMSSPGAVVFQHGGEEYRLEALDEGEPGLFVIFRDGTSGKATYHSGRFLDTEKPDADGHVILDFNFAYSPPCAYTPYATCPLPPRENWLPLAIEAGEKAPPGH